MQTKKTLSSIILASLLFAISPASTTAYSQTNAISYLKSQPLSDWSVMALASSHALAGVNLDSLKSDPGDVPTDVERRILALVAAGQNPETFGPVNLVQKLRDQFNGAEITTAASAGLLNDDIFGLLALAAAGKHNDVQSTLAAFIKTNQNPDGGWSYTRAPATSDSNMTAMGVMALLAFGENKNSEVMGRAYAYLGTTKTATGYNYDAVSNFESDGGSTAWAISALRAGGKTVPQEAVTYLDSLQRANGSFAWQEGNSSGNLLITTYAVIALNNDYYPVKTRGGDSSQTQVLVNIVNGEQTIFGATLTLENATAFGALDKASKQGNFAYTVKNTALGLFVESIAGIGPSGQNGWLYAVNGQKPAIAADGFTLKTGDQLIWYYGAPNDAVPAATGGAVSTQVALAANILPKDTPPPTVSLHASKTSIKIGEAIKLTWQTQNTTRIAASTPNNWAGANPPLAGSVTFQPGQTTTYTIMVEGAGGSAQNSVTITVDPTPSIVFGVNITAVNFGDLKPGQVSTEQAVTLRNHGSGKIQITSSLSGTDPVYQQGLRINDGPWNSYQTDLEANLAREIKLKLAVPSEYNSTGQKTGTLIFWATGK